MKVGDNCAEAKQWQKLVSVRITVRCRALEDISLPIYTGATIRGAFGSALYQISCIDTNKTCADCLVNHSCPYHYLFEGSEISDKPLVTPLVINSNITKTTIEKNEPFSFDIIIFGDAISYIPNTVAAIERMAQNGIGKGRAFFGIDGVVNTNDGQLLYGNGILNDKAEILTIKELAVSDGIVLRFASPLRLKSKGRYICVPTFADLARATLRRTTALIETYCNGRFELPFNEIIEKAKEINIKRDSTEWVEFERFSSRQDKRIPMHGAKGEIEYRGDLRRFGYLIPAMCNINIGSATTFGFGKIEIVDYG